MAGVTQQFAHVRQCIACLPVIYRRGSDSREKNGCFTWTNDLPLILIFLFTALNLLILV